jgi:hypothetical protein
MMIEEQKITAKTIAPPQKKMSWLISDSTVTVNFDGQTTMLSRSDAYADRLIKALKEKDLEAIPTLISAAKRIEKFSHGKFQVRDGKILIDGEEAPPMLGRKIKDFADQGLKYEPLILFAQKLQSSPSKRVLDHLYQFLEKNNFVISENGNFLAYKRVRDDFMDFYTGTMDNSVGNTVKMARNKVDENENRTCSTGLHCCGFSYLQHYHNGSGHILEVEVDPKDVVAIPVDYERSKMRVSSYKVLRVVKEESLDLLRNTNQINENDSCKNCDDDGRTGNCDYNDEEECY